MNYFNLLLNLSSENGSMDKLGDKLKFLGSHQLINQEQFEKFINETVKAYNKYSRKSAKTASEITKLENEKINWLTALKMKSNSQNIKEMKVKLKRVEAAIEENREILRQTAEKAS